MDSQQDLFSDEIKIDAAAQGHIRGLASWAMVVVVVSVVGYVLSIAELIVGKKDAVPVQPEGFSTTVFSGEPDVAGTVITILLGLVVNYFLYRFARSVTAGIEGLSGEKLSSSFRSLKIYFAITSIFMILVLLVLVVVVGVVL